MTKHPIFVTNFNPRFTGVSATMANVVRCHLRSGLNVTLVGHPLPGCPKPISLKEARTFTRDKIRLGQKVVWHVRRNQEMRSAIFLRDVYRLPIKIVFTSAAIRLHSWYPRQLINRVDAVIATSDAAARFVPHVKSIIPHGVDTELFHPDDNRMQAWRELGFPGDYGIATVGRVRPEKGTDRFVDAMITALPNLPGATALLIGTASPKFRNFEMALRQKINCAGLSDRFVFTGEIPPAKMPGTIRSLTLLVQLPRYEGYGMTILEAMASDVPFVASDTGAFAQFADGAEFGRICPNFDGADFADAILRQLKVDAEPANQTALDRFSITSEAKAITEVYDKVFEQ